MALNLYKAVRFGPLYHTEKNNWLFSSALCVWSLLRSPSPLASSLSSWSFLAISAFHLGHVSFITGQSMAFDLVAGFRSVCVSGWFPMAIV